MNIEAIIGDGTEYRFNSRDRNFAPSGIHRIDIPLHEDTYVLTIDNGSNSLGLCIASVTNQQIYFAGNFMKENREQSSFDFCKEFIVFLEHLMKSTKYIGYIKVEKPYNSKDRRFAQSYTVLKFMFDEINRTASRYNAIFIPTMPESWMSVFLKDYGNNSSSNKTRIKNQVKWLYPMLTLKNQDVYDAIGMKEAFFQTDISNGCFLRLNTSTYKNVNLKKEVHYKFYKLTNKKIDYIRDLMTNESISLLTFEKIKFAYNSEYSLIENLKTAFYYRPFDFIIFIIEEIDLKILPDIYYDKFFKDKIKQGEPLILMAHCLGGDKGNVIEI